MLNKIKAMNNFGIEVNEIKEIIDNNKIFILNNNEEYYVLTDTEAQEIYEELQINIIEDIGLEGFTPFAQEYIINNCLDIDYFNEFMEENHREYVENMDEEELIEELENWKVKDEEELIEKLNNQYNNGLELYLEIYEDGIIEVINDLNLMDIQKVIEYCQEVDGRGHIIASYDGKENIIEIDNIDYYIYRLN